MVKVEIEAEKVIFEIESWDKLWSLRSRLEIPLSHIKAVYADPQTTLGWFDGLKVLGTGVPNIFRAGTFYQKGEFVFWDVRDPAKAIVVELEHETYKKLIVEVENPIEEIEKIKTRIT